MSSGPKAEGLLSGFEPVLTIVPSGQVGAPWPTLWGRLECAVRNMDQGKAIAIRAKFAWWTRCQPRERWHYNVEIV